MALVQTIVIGDVHGCADELSALLRACGQSSRDEVVLVGDLVAKGPDSRGVLAIVREVSARAVCGNHDARVLSWKRAVDRGQPPPKLGKSHQEVVDALDERDFALLDALPLFLRLPRHRAIVVHAGLVPGVPLEEQDPELMMNMRTLRADGTGSRSPVDGPLWGSAWPGPELVLFGHHALQGLQQHPFAVGLDTGCVYGGRLTACILPERRLLSVPARRAYAPVDKERG
jgi:hypothetical protein